LLIVLVAPIGAIVAIRWLDPPTTAFVVHQRLENALDGRHVAIRRSWVSWSEISTSAKLAVIASEDQRFAEHFGFDVKQIAASIDDARDGGRLRGASTITQQVAKNLFLWPGQNWIRKALEAYLTVAIEALWPKQRILEVYLNVAELGDGIYGVEAAAQVFYGKHASMLNAPESAMLAAALPSPKRLRVSAPGPYMRSRQAWILTQMRRLGGSGYLEGL
jgi:monofunctional biosynthetic peptidoglycan transglycosylase